MAVAVALLGLIGGFVAGTRQSGPGRSPLDVQATGGVDHGRSGAPLPDLDPSSTSSTATLSSSSSTTTTARPVTTLPKLPRTTITSSSTTTTTVACAPADPVYAFGLFRRPDGNGWVAGANPALQRSTDGGQTWTPACLPPEVVTGPGVLHTIAFAPDGRHGWVVGTSGGHPIALRTDDGGDHWTAALLPVGLTGTLNDVGFGDLLHGWAVGNLTAIGIGPARTTGPVVLATSDGGATWTAQLVPEGIGRLDGVATVDASHAWAVGVGFSGRPALIATGDGGATWLPQTLPDGIRELRDVAFLDRDRGWAVGAGPEGTAGPDPVQGDPGVILTTSDGGATWAGQATTEGSLWSLAIVDGQNLFAGAAYGLYSTHDGGGTWARQVFSLPALDAISFTDATHGWVTHSMFSTVCRTDDGGRTWTGSAVNPRGHPFACVPS